MSQTDTLLQQIDSSCNLNMLDELFTTDKLYHLLLFGDGVSLGLCYLNHNFWRLI